MESDTIRLIIEEAEHEVLWTKDTDESSIMDITVYIIDQLRKKISH